MDWRSYDSAAAAHERLRVPVLFAPPARDLAARMEFDTAQRALDVGTGSGVVARAAAACPFVVGADPSLEMLRIARESGVAHVTVSAVPGLPFPDGAFDRVTAGFVLSHVAACEDAVRDMVRVLRPEGLLGATAWADRSSEHTALWNSVMERFVDRATLRSVSAEALPWEERLARENGLRDLLASAGLRDLTVDRIAYPVQWTIDSFLEMRDTSTASRYLRAVDPAAWPRFRDAVAREFQARFQDPLVTTLSAWIAVGRAIVPAAGFQPGFQPAH
jgi:SAM-dependent methyltransferase